MAQTGMETARILSGIIREIKPDLVIAIDALNAGKHVFCEKPDCISVQNALDMKAASEKNGKTLMVMRNNRFVPASQYARRYIQEGNAGEIYAAHCAWQRRRGIPGMGGWFTTKARSGGGPLIAVLDAVIDRVAQLDFVNLGHDVEARHARTLPKRRRGRPRRHHRAPRHATTKHEAKENGEARSREGRVLRHEGRLIAS